jgi:hypothetical protein
MAHLRLAPTSSASSSVTERLSPSGELANLNMPTLAEVIDQAHRGVELVRRTPHLAYSLLRRTGLSVATAS